MEEKLRQDALKIFEASLEAVDPYTAMKRWVRREEDVLHIGERSYSINDYENIYVCGGGKASTSMALALEGILGDALSRGVINTKYGYINSLEKIEMIEAGHPLPDENGVKGAENIMELVSSAGEKDLILCVISGGGSALMSLPQDGISLEDVQGTTQLLLDCGATIDEINALRKHLSRIKGGNLARCAYPATVVSLLLSDVVGDRLDVIGSGPTVPDESTFDDCIEIIRKYDLEDRLPESVLSHMEKGARGEVPETPKHGAKEFRNSHVVIIGSNIQALRAAKTKSDELGYNSVILSSTIEGETRDVAVMHTSILKDVRSSGSPISAPACIISGGETTVTIKGDGKGGRNQEFVLATAIEIAGMENVAVLSGGTDGTDGPTDAAGALADGYTLKRAEEKGLSALKYLENNDSYNFFDELGDLLKTGPTNTNVMDVRLLLAG